MEDKIKKIRETFDKADVLSWRRRDKKLKDIIENKLKPIEDQILELELSKVPFYDEVQLIRKEMVDICIHPEDHLVELEGEVILCKFCNKKLKLHG